MSEAETEPPKEAAREAAIAALLAPVPVVPVPTAAQWHEVRQHGVDPKSLY